MKQQMTFRIKTNSENVNDYNENIMILTHKTYTIIGIYR